MAFPTSPTNGQQANINGITYTYSSAATAWTVSTSVSNTFVSINVSDNVNSGNVLATGVISATGNVLGGNLVVTGNIVDTGALTIVTGSNGNITLSPDGTGIVATTGAISTTGNISANNATFTSNQTLSYGTANGVAYLNGSKVLTTGSALVFDGTNLGVGAPSAWGGSYKALQANRASLSSVGGTVFLGANFYNNGTSSTYIATDFASLYGMADGQHRFYTAPSGTAGNSISFTQAMTLNANGALALQGASTSATGVGITFPATQSASTDANTLDDYEEGTWTPNQGSGLTVVGAFSSSGTYTKIGSVVMVTGILFGATSIRTGALGLVTTNLPFAQGTGNWIGRCLDSLWASSTDIIVSAATIYSATATTANTYIFFSVTYRV